MKKILAIALALLLLLACAAAEETAVVAPGYTLVLGTYPQTEAGDDQTPIEWIVLDVQDGKALLLSRYALDVQCFNEAEGDVTWEQSTLRAWLNGAFLDAAFTEEEKAVILEADVDNGAGQGYSAWETEGGNNTRDRVFLLSIGETKRYFNADTAGENTDSRAAATPYAVAQGAYAAAESPTATGEPATWWWLRSPGTTQDSASSVTDVGVLTQNIATNRDAVRPALWVDLAGIR